jgi:hypothetical protein
MSFDRDRWKSTESNADADELGAARAMTSSRRRANSELGRADRGEVRGMRKEDPHPSLRY